MFYMVSIKILISGPLTLILFSPFRFYQLNFLIVEYLWRFLVLEIISRVRFLIHSYVLAYALTSSVKWVHSRSPVHSGI